MSTAHTDQHALSSFTRHTQKPPLACPVLCQSLQQQGSQQSTHSQAACRGYGGSAHKTPALLKEGKTDYKQSGKLGFPEGSYANGGAMRIAPVGLAYR